MLINGTWPTDCEGAQNADADVVCLDIEESQVFASPLIPFVLQAVIAGTLPVLLQPITNLATTCRHCKIKVNVVTSFLNVAIPSFSKASIEGNCNANCRNMKT